MLNDSQEASTLLSDIKTQLKELFHAKIPITQKFQEMFNKEEISRKVIDCFNQIQVPYNRL